MLWEINSLMDQAGTSPVKTTELSTFIPATILPLATAVVQFKEHSFNVCPCHQPGHSSRMQTGTVPTGTLWVQGWVHREPGHKVQGTRGNSIISRTLVWRIPVQS